MADISMYQVEEDNDWLVIDESIESLEGTLRNRDDDFVEVEAPRPAKPYRRQPVTYLRGGPGHTPGHPVAKPRTGFAQFRDLEPDLSREGEPDEAGEGEPDEAGEREPDEAGEGDGEPVDNTDYIVPQTHQVVHGVPERREFSGENLRILTELGEPDDGSSSSDEAPATLNDSFTSRGSGGGLHSPRSPGGTRLEDQLPAFVPPKRYVKPEEKKDTKAPGVMIMESEESPRNQGNSDVNGWRPDTASTSDDNASQRQDTPESTNTEYEIKPSQPFGSLLAKWKDPSQGAGDSMCKVCGKRVYEMEKVIADKNVYHKMCFKCYHCGGFLSMTNFSSMGGNLYCKPHLMELFKSKGNYEEGFGKERHLRQWTPLEDGNTDNHNGDGEPESNLRGSADSEDAHVEVLKEEDKLDDGIESVPSIRNLKSRFETKDSTPPPLPTDHSTKIRSRSPYGAGGRTPSGDEDQVGYMSYTQSNHSDYIDNTEDATPRRVSKWDKPKEAPPPPVNREGAEEEAVESELPAIGTSRSMAARFQQQQSETQAERKPVRRITPPREELRRTIEDSDIQYDSDVVRSGDTNGQEELPPAEYTRSMLAKFRSIENTGAPAPSPVRSAQISNQVRRTQTTTYQQHRQPVNRPSPDSGISDSESQNVNGDDGGVAENNPLVLSDVVREADRHHEEELPETGTTRSLLAQWRNMEQTVQKQCSATSEHLRPKSQTRQWSVNTPGSAGRQGYNGGGNNQYDRTDSTYDEDREVIRADDNVEDELPAPSTTRNMLARFQEMQEEAQREASNLKTPPPSKKQFKWTVKEAKPLFKGRRDSGPIDANGYHEDGVDYQNGDVTHHHGDQDADSSDDQVWRQNEDVVRADQPVEEEMPAPETTRSMLAMFKSMEDVNRPPPTPEHAQKAVKQSTPMRTASIHRGSSTSSHGRSSHYSNHVNGHDSDGGGDGYHSDDREAGGYLSNGSHDDLNRGYDRYGGEFENDPQRNPDVVREDTANETEVLPEQGTTKNLLAKFQALQAI